MSLPILATEDNWQAFDEAWNELIKTQGPIEDLVQAMEIVAAKRRLARCLPLLREHAEKLASAKRCEDAALLLGAALRGGAAVGAVADLLWRNAEAAWGTLPWWNPYIELSGFRPSANDLKRAWVCFDDMRSYAPGVVIFHRGGWGIGEVTDFTPGELELGVRFVSGRKDRFPLRTAVDIFERLADYDLRAQHLRDPAALKQRVQNEPLEILRAVLLRHSGKASQISIKNALAQVGVDGNAWSTWWRKTRMQAENSEWFRVSGSGQKVEIEILRRALDPVASLKRQLEHAPTLAVALSRARDIFGSNKLEQSVRDAGLDVLERLTVTPKTPLDDRLSTWMLLREHRNQTPEGLANMLKEALAKPVPTDPSIPSPVWALIQQIPLARDQERAVVLLQEVYGEGWIDEAAKNLHHAPPGMVKPLIDALLAAKRTEALAQQYSMLLARPMRSPFALLALIRVAEDGKITGDFATPVQRAHALIELAAQLAEGRRGNALLARAEQRLIDVMTKGQPPLLQTWLAEADLPVYRQLRATLQRGVADEIDAAITDAALSRGIDLLRAEEVPFWEEDRIWTTRAGLAKRQAELREVRDVKLPQNAEAIGKAAAFGDLSENFEWAQAIEEQRHLTEAAATIERELRIAALLENAPIADGMVSPGTLVRYRDITNAEVHDVAILGPWDNEPNAISYRAPLAAGMLGLSAGTKATIELPGGRIEVEVLAVEPAPVH
ncbi:MAG: GreA/GreB family elongation factor [Planctomycetes bacterium]|nr:GreA/GreB family elongation factor [Planctomycetota bacterium]